MVGPTGANNVTNLDLRGATVQSVKLRVLGKVGNLGVIFSDFLNSGLFYFTYTQILKLRVRNVREIF